uniref:Uncharacterized protein n=1 Tax=Romanomermis culicivorax TaxID=13658 RepID=A0A915HQ21_ROMCU
MFPNRFSTSTTKKQNLEVNGSSIATPKRQFLKDFLENIQIDGLILSDEENCDEECNQKDQDENIIQQLNVLLFHLEMLKKRAAKINQHYTKMKNEYRLKTKENQHLKVALTEEESKKKNLVEENRRLKSQLENLIKCQTLDAANLYHSMGYMKNDR